MRLSEKED